MDLSRPPPTDLPMLSPRLCEIGWLTGGAENDIVLLKRKNESSADPVLTQPLRPNTRIPIYGTKGYVLADEILAQGWRDSVRWMSDKPAYKRMAEYRILEPTLADYVAYSSRLVTPIYPADANLIVSLLDLHPTTPTDPNPAEKIEIFEAGTGHGALTLHLARAIHGANAAAPTLPRLNYGQATARAKGEDIDTVAPPKSVEELELDREIQTEREVFDDWRAQRRAVIHTLDNNPSHSGFAKRTIRNFRRGMYFPHIDFHVGGINEYLSARLRETEEAFLDHAILDLPGTHDYLEIVGKSLKPNGLLVTFCPSVTQILRCVTLVKEQRLPYVLEKVLELGSSVGSGGREWDIRAVKPRAIAKLEAAAREEDEGLSVSESVENIEVSGQGTVASECDSHWETICRPKPGVRTIGGGFVGLWRRMEQKPVKEIVL
ncbi:tRNA (Adenine-N(1)-)-methyltransferase [Phlyctema vagabunda]|uniref:tRNA (adenine(58)-N(1))-methyltransferase catalytic subunit TRM61 n=1 Tax=Phlyctema vagabunda TaxID=108571 RepID=A0ABR4PKZ1_9HELO